MNRPAFYFANAGLGIFTDFATVVVPMYVAVWKKNPGKCANFNFRPWLHRLQMPLGQKVAVAVILAMGCL